MSRENTFELVGRLARAKLRNVPYAGHEAHKDQPEIVGTIVERFIASA